MTTVENCVFAGMKEYVGRAQKVGVDKCVVVFYKTKPYIFFRRQSINDGAGWMYVGIDYR